MRVADEMKKDRATNLRPRHFFDQTSAAMSRMEAYCNAHPGNPSAVRRPQLLLRGQLWVALLGPNVEEGIVGIGPSVEAALRAFDRQYLAGLSAPPRAKNAAAEFEAGHDGRLVAPRLVTRAAQNCGFRR